MNFFVPDRVGIRLAEIRDGVLYNKVLEQCFNAYDKNKNEWNRIASDSEKLPSYLKNKYYL